MGYTQAYTVGVWAGNFEAEPMKGISGVSGAAYGPVNRTTWVLNGRELPPGPQPLGGACF